MESKNVLKIDLEDFDSLEEIFIEKKQILESAMEIQKLEDIFENNDFTFNNENEILGNNLQILNSPKSNETYNYEVEVYNISEIKDMLEKKRNIISHQYEIRQLENELKDKDFVNQINNFFKFRRSKFETMICRKYQYKKMDY